MEQATAAGLGSPVLRRTSMRKDAWWIQPLLVVSVLGAFGLYSTWAAFQHAHYEIGDDPADGRAHYLSPFYSPYIPDSFLASLGLPQDGIFFNLFSPAFFILWIPLGFRLTCYYYRKSIYRSFLADPPGCAVKEPALRKSYHGETKFPFILMNLHRYFVYITIVVVAFLVWDTLIAFNWDGEFGIGIGTLVLLLNVVLLTAYTFSCHSVRHIVGGQLDCFSCDNLTQGRYKGWKVVSMLNKNHMLWAWVSMFSVGLADLYIRLCSMGIIQDVRLF